MTDLYGIAVQRLSTNALTQSTVGNTLSESWTLSKLSDNDSSLGTAEWP